MKLTASTLRFSSLLQFCIFGAILIFGAPCFSATYYVDNRDGDDLNDGSKSAPWKTVTKVNSSQFLPGDWILFARGRTWNEMLKVPSSGVEGQNIVIDAYGRGFKPVFDCTVPLTGTWVQDAQNPNIYSIARNSAPGSLFYNGVVRHAIFTITLDPATETVPNAGAVLMQATGGAYNNIWLTSVDPAAKIVSGINNFSSWDTQRTMIVRQENPDTGKEETWPTQLPAPVDLTPKNISLQKNGDWNWRDGNIYLYSDVHPDSLTIRIPRQSFGIHTNQQSYLNIKNIKIFGPNSAGVYLSGTGHSTVQKIRVTGTGAAGYHTGILLNDSTYNSIAFNRIEQSLGAGIGIYGNMQNQNSARNNTIMNNYIIDSGSAGIVAGADSTIRANKVINTTIVGNIIIRSNQMGYDSAGIYMYFAGDGNVIKRNRIYDGGNGQLRSSGIMVDINVGPVLIERNTIKNNSHGGIVVTETDHIIRYNYLQNNSYPQFKSAEVMFFPVNDFVANVQMYDNMITAESDKALLRIEPGCDINHYIDNNKYVGGDVSPFYLENQWLTFTEWQQVSGHDLDSKY